MSRAIAVVVGVVLGGATTLAATVPSTPRTVHIDIQHSRFVPDALLIHPGERVRFVIRNHDPIGHEFILGDREVQAIHEVGHQAHHARPGEVSVPAGATVETSYAFQSPGGLLYGCHLPGHWAYGMHGTVLVA